MTQVCTICRHEKRQDIEIEMVRAVPYRDIAGRYSLSKSAVARHASAHLPAALARAAEAEGEASADTILAQVAELRDAALAVLNDAQGIEDAEIALKAVREARGCVELLAKVAGQLQTAPTVNFLVSPEWASVQTAILAALTDHPQARVAVAGALKRLEAPHADAA